jgi:hypothetical protein
MGCTRICTPEDHAQAKTSAIQNMSVEKISKERRAKIREAMNKAPAKLLANILADKKHRAHQSVVSLAAKAILCDMKTMHKEKVPQALSIVLNKYPDAMGIFKAVPKHRAPGMAPLLHHYEITSTAALVKSRFSTTSGKILTLIDSTKSDFGVKMARGYGQPKRFGTIEADVLAHKDSIIPGIKPIILGIDQKYSKTGTYGVKKGFSRQLEGIRTGFSDGKIDQFYFVTNGNFTKNFSDQVKATNLEIAKDHAEKYNANINYGDPQYFTRKERVNIPTEKIALDRFKDVERFEKDKELKDYIAKYNIPQIELCQHVKFKG